METRTISEWLEDQRFMYSMYNNLLIIAKGQVLALRPHMSAAQTETAMHECVADGIVAVSRLLIEKQGRGPEQITADNLQVEIRKLATKKQFGPYSTLTRRWIERQQSQEKRSNRTTSYDPDAHQSNASTRASQITDVDLLKLLKAFAQESEENQYHADILLEALFQDREESADHPVEKPKISQKVFEQAIAAVRAFAKKNPEIQGLATPEAETSGS